MKHLLLKAALLLAGAVTAGAAAPAPAPAAEADKPAAAPTCGDAGACALNLTAVAKLAQEAAAPEAVGYGHVDTAGLKALINAKTPMLLLDARSGKWDDGQRLPGAKALAPDATDAEIAAALPAKDALVIAYCSNPKCQASRILAAKLVNLGYTNILKYPEGTAGCLAAGNPVDKAK